MDIAEEEKIRWSKDLITYYEECKAAKERSKRWESLDGRLQNYNKI